MHGIVDCREGSLANDLEGSVNDLDATSNVATFIVESRETAQKCRVKRL